MTDQTDELALARANAEGWAARAAEIEAQQAVQDQGRPLADGYAVSNNRLGPEGDLIELVKRADRSGLRAEEVEGLAIAALARGALAGDERYLYRPVEVRRITAGEQ